MDVATISSAPGGEQRALGASAAGTAIVGAVGVVWGILASSQIVLFDGMYATIGIVLTWMALHASRAAAAGPTARFPYGREALTPLVVGVQGIALLATCVYGSFSAVLSILAGGKDVAAGSVLAYGVLSAVGSTAMWLWLRRRAGGSDLVDAEATVWLVGAALSVGMVIAFGFVLVFDGTEYGDVARYADPALVIAFSILLVPTPLSMLRRTFVELLEGAPDPYIQRAVADVVDGVRAAHGLGEPFLFMTKLGPKLYIEADFVVDPDAWRVADADAVRRDLAAALGAALPYELWLNIELTGDARFAT